MHQGAVNDGTWDSQRSLWFCDQFCSERSSLRESQAIVTMIGGLGTDPSSLNGMGERERKHEERESFLVHNKAGSHWYQV